MAITDRATRSWSDTLWEWALSACIVAMPLKLLIIVPRSGPYLVQKLPLVDGLLWLVLLAALMSSTRRRQVLRRLAAPPTAFVAIGLLASLPRLGGDASFAECLQRLDYYLIVFLVSGIVSTTRLATLLRRVLPSMTLVCLGLALVQIYVLRESSWRADAIFENRHQFGAWVALVLAFEIARGEHLGLRGWLRVVVLALLAAVTTTTVLPFVGIGAGIGVAWSAQAKPRRWRPHAALLLLSVGMLVLVARDQQLHQALEAWSRTDAADADESRRTGIEVDSITMKTDLFSFPLGDKTIHVATRNWRPNVEPPPDQRRIDRFEPSYVKQRYLEWQAGLYAMAKHPILGTGLGSYQSRISRSYLTFKNLKTLVPDTQSGYIIEMVSVGLAGLVALLWFLLWIGRAALRTERTGKCEVGAQPGRCTLAVVLTAAVLGIATPLFQSYLMALVILVSAADPGTSPGGGNRNPLHRRHRPLTAGIALRHGRCISCW